MSENITVEIIVVGQYKTNCYLVIDNLSQSSLIIDPGDDADFIIRRIADLNVLPKEIIATHGHFDHLSAAFELQKAFNIPFFMNEKDGFLVSRTATTYKRFVGVSGSVNPKPDGNLSKRDVVKLGNLNFDILELPGHTPGSIALYSETENLVFSGDLIFNNCSIGEYDKKYSDISDLKESVDKLTIFPGDTKVYPGHGDPFNIEDFNKLYSVINIPS